MIDGIDYVFERNPEFKEIGTKTQYSKYLKTIFPKSKFTKVVWHHSNKKIKKFKSNFKKGYAYSRGVSPKAIFFLGAPVKKEFLSKRPHLGAYLLNSINPLVIKNKKRDSKAKEKSGIKEGVEKALAENFDGVVFNNIWDNCVWTDVYVVFKPSKVHILGSKKDFKKFKKFVKPKLDKK